MADLTARLLWYRLGESSQHLPLLWDGISFIVDAGGTVLNYIFVFWLLFGVLTIVIVSIIHHHDAARSAKTAHSQMLPNEFVCKVCKKEKTYTCQPTISTSASKNFIESNPVTSHIDWHNSLLEWLRNQDTQWKAPLMENLLTVMTEESRKLAGDLFVTFEAFLPVGDPPLLNIDKVEADTTEDNNKLVLSGDIQLSGVQMSLTVSDNSVSIHSNLLLIIHLLKSKLMIEVKTKADTLSLMIRSGDINTSDIQFLPYHQGVDCITDERRLTHHVSAILTRIALPITISLKTGDIQVPPVHKALTPTDSAGSTRPPKPPRSMEDKRLMIKLIKATRLDCRNIATMDAFCVVEVDSPYQTHSTSVVKNTVNPYWDEHFLFDLGIYTKTVTFRVYGHSNQTEDNKNCLGECQLELEKLRVNHGVRMILPLESRPDMADPVSGSVTIEAFFVEAAEFEPSSTPEVDYAFSQSVEPLTSDADMESPFSERMSINGDSRLSSLSLTGSTTKIIKTSTYVQKDSVSYGSQNSGSLPMVEKAETVQNITSDSGTVSEHIQEALPASVDLANAEFSRVNSASPLEDFQKPRFSMTLGRKRASRLSLKFDRPHSFTIGVITVYPNQSVTDVVVRELKQRAKRSKASGGHTTSTIIITAATRIPHVEQPLISLAAFESLSDDSSGGTPSINWDVSRQQQQFQQAAHTPPPQIQQPTIELIVPKPLEPQTSTERKSRLSGLKKRFTRTKDKKPRSHSIERSSGIDEHRYLDPSYNATLDTSKSDATLGAFSKKKFGGSLRKLFRFGSRSSSSPRQKYLSPDNERYYDSYGRRLSVEGSRPDNHGSRSSMERSMTPPHHRTLSPSSSYDYRSPFSDDAPRRSETVNIGATIDIEGGLRPSSYDEGQHYSMPSVHRHD